MSDPSLSAGVSVRAVLTIAFVTSIGFVAGCSERVAEVNGSIVYKGKPVTSGYVTMIGTNGIPQQATINEDGSYMLKTVPLGEVKILVTSPPLQAKADARKKGERLDPDTGKPVPKKQDEMGPVGTALQKETWRELPPQFADVRQTKLTYTVNAGKNSYEIKLD